MILKLNFSPTILLTILSYSIAFTFVSGLVAPATCFLVSWIIHSDPGSVNDVECSHGGTSLGEVDLVFPIAVVFSLECSILVSIINDTVSDDSSEGANVLHDESVRSIEVETRYIDCDFFLSGWTYESSFNCFRDSNAFILTEPVKIYAVAEPDVDALAPLKVTFNILTDIDPKSFEEASNGVRFSLLFQVTLVLSLSE